MPFLKTACATVTKPSLGNGEWQDYKSAIVCRDGICLADGRRMKVAERAIRGYNPRDYVLSHVTIMASVDTETGDRESATYPDYFVTPETSQFMNNNCLVPGTMVLMADGTEKPIEEVKVGDRVITHLGRVRTVVETFIHPFKGYLKKVTRLGDSRPLLITPEHPVWAKQPPTECACGCGAKLERRKYKAAANRFKDFKRGHWFRRKESPQYDWILSKDLNDGDMLAYPRFGGEVETPVTLRQAELLGYFLAEGFYYKQKPYRIAVSDREDFGATGEESVPVAVCFALHKDEEETLAERIRDLLLLEFGVDSRVDPCSNGSNGIQLVSHQSSEVVKFFQSYCLGEGAKNKHLKEEAHSWGLEHQRLMLRAYLEGDGTHKKTTTGWLNYFTSSEKLANQVQLILSRLGVFSTRYTRTAAGRKREGGRVVDDPTKECHSWVVQVCAAMAPPLIKGSFLEEQFYKVASKRKKLLTLSNRVEDKQLVFPIRSVEDEWYEGSVYNFETEEDHSYVANGVSVHNSDSWEKRLLLATYKTFIGSENYCEHVQKPVLSKGKIIDAVAREAPIFHPVSGEQLFYPSGEPVTTIYIDILVATSRKFEDLSEDILTGKANAMSMGCLLKFTICSQCGTVIYRDDDACSHIKYAKGDHFTDLSGQTRIITELCGHWTDPKSCDFIEASWVSIPAFRGARSRQILQVDEIKVAGQLNQAYRIAAQRFHEIYKPKKKLAALNNQIYTGRIVELARRIRSA